MKRFVRRISAKNRPQPTCISGWEMQVNPFPGLASSVSLSIWSIMVNGKGIMGPLDFVCTTIRLKRR